MQFIDQLSRLKLILFSKFHNNSTFRTLIQHGADLDRVDQDSFTPLLWAASKDRLEMVRLLIDKGANVNVTNSDEASPLWHAARQARLKIGSILSFV